MIKRITLLTLFIITSVMMAGCAEEEPIVFEAITVPGFEVEVETLLRVKSPEFDDYGNLVDETYVVNDDLTDLLELLEDLEIAEPMIPANEFTFTIKLISYEFYHGNNESGEGSRALPIPEVTVTITEAGTVRFPDIVFTDAGVFTYQITQLADILDYKDEEEVNKEEINKEEVDGEEVDEEDIDEEGADEEDGINHNWTIIESSVDITVRVSEDLETGILVADVEKDNDFAFVNVFYYDISEEVRVEVQRLQEDRLERLCEEPDLTPILSALERYGDGVAIYFENLDTGCVFSHNPEKNFFAASVTKAPLALWIYTKAEEGYVCLDMTMYFTAENLRLRSGIIRYDYELGHYFPLRRVIALNLYESDNTATEMLRQEFGYEGYADFIEELGGTREYAVDIWNSRITADEAGFFARQIYEYIESDGRYSDEFRQNLLNNQFPFIIADYPVASKTGWHEYFGACMTWPLYTLHRRTFWQF